MPGIPEQDTKQATAAARVSEKPDLHGRTYTNQQRLDETARSQHQQPLSHKYRIVSNNAAAPGRRTTVPETANSIPDIPTIVRHSANTSIQTHTHAHTQNNSTFNEQLNEMNTINSLVNMESLLQATKDLNNQLRNCQTPLEKLIAFQNFAKNISQYNI